MDRGEQIANELISIVDERGREYGDQTRNFQRIASLWTAYMHNSGRQVVISHKDVAPLMILMKLARMQNPTLKDDYDTLLDICGYAVCQARLTE